ncbi:Crp/Fnr family transcriptional regulator [Pseudomonas sp. ABC1]|uniref:Crp/Fnr family transcriptional regulator n=1 Tax=Pseudomonas sp. ABC1 TaxID=2748080 RepID=UPI0015C344D0|nr:Crp/Fnr family transcriptional regulator [Pseudomonas sp. ABC1]QLF92644.1 Crp/Fnr family transcriptional regulator [Pseudomonas sp. ABC1]
MPTDRDLIRNLPLFAALDEDALDEALSHAQECHFEKGEYAFRQGEPAQYFFLLLGGHLQTLQVTPAGERVVVRYVHAGELFGIAKAMALSTYPASSIAVESSRVLRWPSAQWEALNRACAQLTGHVVQTVGQRLQEAHQRIQELSTERVEQRVAHALLRLAQQSGRATASGVSIDFPLSRQDLAEMTGTTLHTVSRVLSAWKEQGLLQLGRQHVVLLDLPGLSRHAERQESD